MTDDPEHSPTPGLLNARLFVTLAAAAVLFVSGFMLGRATSESGMSMHDAMRGDRAPAAESKPGMRGEGMMSGAMMGEGMMGSMSVASESEFLAEMIPHHDEAISSAKVLKAGTDRKEMKTFADEIIKTQQREVDDMRAWLKRWYPDVKVSDNYEAMMRSDLDSLEGDDLDQAFLEDMSSHHMMAVHMSRSLLEQDLVKHDEVDTLARSIRDSQMREISMMQDWLSDWFDVQLSHQDMMARMH